MAEQRPVVQAGEDFAARNAPAHIAVAGNSLGSWMTAAVLAKMYHNTGTKISLITNAEAAPRSGPVSVLPSFAQFLQFLNLREADFMRATQATFKLSTLYRGWLGADHAHHQAFGEFGAPLCDMAFHHLHIAAAKRLGLKHPYHSYSLAALAAEADRFMHPIANKNSILSTLEYGWQFDQALFFSWLKKSVASQLEIHDAKINAVSLAANGEIKALKLAKSVISANFFVDSTRDGVLKSARGPERVATQLWSAALATDYRVQVFTQAPPRNITANVVSAVANGIENIQVDREKVSITLHTRQSLVDENMHRRLTQRFGQASVLFTGVASACIQNAWVGNCVTVGAAAIKVNSPVISEIDLAWLGLQPMTKYAPTAGASGPLAQQYNAVVAKRCLNVKDQAVLLGVLGASKGGAYWGSQSATELSDGLKAKLLLFDECGALPGRESNVFSLREQMKLLLGMNRIPDDVCFRTIQIADETLRQHLVKIQRAIAAAVQKMPRQSAYLQEYLGEPRQPPREN